MKAPRVCRVCDRELPPPSLSAIQRAQMWGWWLSERCEECQRLAPRRIARAELERARAKANESNYDRAIQQQREDE
jgi:hypothetical protein